MSGPIFPTIFYLYPLNTQTIQIAGLQDTVDGTYINNATVTATLFDYRGRPDPVLQNIPMSYVAGSNGSYQGTVPDTFNPPLGTGYTLQITADSGGVQALWSIPAKVELRAN